MTEKADLAKLKAEARKEALADLKPELVKAYKEEELEKITHRNKDGKKIDVKDKLEKSFGPLAQAFSMEGTGFGSKEKMDYMLGGSRLQGKGMSDGGGFASKDKMDMMLGGGLPKGKKEKQGKKSKWDV
jgi:hypothetical protein